MQVSTGVIVKLLLEYYRALKLWKSADNIAWSWRWLHYTVCEWMLQARQDNEIDDDDGDDLRKTVVSRKRRHASTGHHHNRVRTI